MKEIKLIKIHSAEDPKDNRYEILIDGRVFRSGITLDDCRDILLKEGDKDDS